jgi:hypothetical protein
VLIEELQWMQNHLSAWVKEANDEAVKVMERHGREINNLHFYFHEPEKQVGTFRIINKV